MTRLYLAALGVAVTLAAMPGHRAANAPKLAITQRRDHRHGVRHLAGQARRRPLNAELDLVHPALEHHKRGHKAVLDADAAHGFRCVGIGNQRAPRPFIQPRLTASVLVRPFAIDRNARSGGILHVALPALVGHIHVDQHTVDALNIGAVEMAALAVGGSQASAFLRASCSARVPFRASNPSATSSSRHTRRRIGTSRPMSPAQSGQSSGR